MDGVDPAQIDWDAEFAPDMENVRVAQETWRTRAGYAPWLSIPGAGPVRFLSDLYQSNGAITRLAARGTGAGAQLYELKVGTDVVFVAATGGAGLGGTTQNLFQGVTNQDRFYFTDRAGALRKYQPANWSPQAVHTIPVANPAAPVAAATATPRWYNRLEDWSSGWNDSDASFADSDHTALSPPPAPATKTRVLLLGSGTALGQTITKPTPATNLNSHTIAFWVFQDILKSTVDFQFGIGSATDYDVKLRDNSQVAGEWYPIFAPIGDITALNYVRFQALTAGGTPLGVLVSTLFLPGRLEGEYRWIYTHYDPVNDRESPPSAPTNNGQPLDFSLAGTSWDPNSSRAFAKSCALRFTSDSGVDATTTRIRVYRSGGVPSLTIDEQTGNDLWLRVDEIPDFATTISHGGGESANAGLLHLATVVGLAVGNYLVLEPGVVGKEEYVQITGVSGTTPGTVNVALGGGTAGTTQYSHADTSSVQIALIDNVPNEEIDLTHPVDLRRDNPPTAARWVIRSPEGRLILMNYTDAQGNRRPCGIAFSNKPTPDRPNDFETMPDGVDPLTTHSLTQGFRVDFTGGAAADEEIVWGGYYNGWLSYFTRRAYYVVSANSQSEWGPTSIQKVHNTGCIAGDTVTEVNGVLYWMADGPRLMRWGGSGAPESVSDLRFNVHLAAAPSAYWGNWFAKAHTIQDGHYYILFYTPAGATLNTAQLQYNRDRDAFEPVVYYDAGGNPIATQAAAVRAGNVDSPDLYQADSMGNVVQTESGLLDGTAPVKVRLSTWKIPLRLVHPYWQAFVATSLVHSALIRLAPVADTAVATLVVGGGEYPVTTHSYTLNLNGSVDHEIKVRAHRDLSGRWLQVTITGDFSNRPAFRDLSLFYLPWRVGRISTNHP
jgi:hypothetical protein